jgi:pyruvate/2-oxoacid:ferredoxin oxidoreductase alpha subunit
MKLKEITNTQKVITGNHAVSYGVLLSKAKVISAYPITPQTQVVELLSEFCASGLLDAKFIKVESEHSAMSACIGASISGVRTFTATSSHGLALMHEMLHWAVGARLPIVLADINRAMGPGWSVWTDQNDSLSQRDVGLIQYYCESNQEVLDTVIQAFKLAEKVLLPVMLVLDAFVLSHTSEPVSVPSQELVDEFLPPYKPRHFIDVRNPSAFGGLTNPDHYFEIRSKIEDAHKEALKTAKLVDYEFRQVFDRGYGLVEPYPEEVSNGAEIILVTSGTITGTAREVVDEERRKGHDVGLLKVRLFRPTPADDLRNILLQAKKVAIIDRNISFGHSGIFAQEIKSALYNYMPRPKIFDFILGLGGRDVTDRDIKEVIAYTATHDTMSEDYVMIGLRD